jgi:hypothetical protein
LVESQTGVVPLHAPISAVVHWAQEAVPGLQTGVVPAQLASLAQASQVPASAPLATQTAETQARLATACTQDPPGTGCPLFTLG